MQPQKCEMTSGFKVMQKSLYWPLSSGDIVSLLSQWVRREMRRLPFYTSWSYFPENIP